MKRILITGGGRLSGEVHIQGAKNSVLPILAAAALHRGVSVLENCPRLSDVETAAEILRSLGAAVTRSGDRLTVDATALQSRPIPQPLMARMRSSVIFLGALLARFGEAELYAPGGCALGARPIDLHLQALSQLGAALTAEDGCLRATAQHLRGAELTLALPSVGATENAILCALGAEGVTTIRNAAREPEIEDLQGFLRALGARVSGAGSGSITVEGKVPLHDGTYRIMPDRIVAATYLAAGATCGGEIRLLGAEERRLAAVLAPLRAAGCVIAAESGGLTLRRTSPLQAAGTIRTAVYPGFPTDAQALLMAALLRSRGVTEFEENIFESRYRHVGELMRMGADIQLAGRRATVRGVERLHAAELHCPDLRGGAALALAALTAEGESAIYDTEHIERGYQDLVGELAALGATIRQEG